MPCEGKNDTNFEPIDLNSWTTYPLKHLPLGGCGLYLLVRFKSYLKNAWRINETSLRQVETLVFNLDQRFLMIFIATSSFLLMHLSLSLFLFMSPIS